MGKDNIVDESPSWTRDLSVRTGICPHCGQSISVILSGEKCYFCKKKVQWKPLEWICGLPFVTVGEEL